MPYALPPLSDTTRNVKRVPGKPKINATIAPAGLIASLGPHSRIADVGENPDSRYAGIRHRRGIDAESFLSKGGGRNKNPEQYGEDTTDCDFVC